MRDRPWSRRLETPRARNGGDAAPDQSAEPCGKGDHPMTQVIEEPGTAEEILHSKDTLGRRLHDVLHRAPALSPLIVLILAGIVFGLANGRFFTPENLSIVLQQAAIVGSLAVGQT